MPHVLLPLFALSGLAVLVYEVCWLKILAGALSNSSHALSLVLAGFLLGLALGARAFCGVAPALRRPLRTYAWLEAVVALAAWLVPGALRSITESSWAGSLAGDAGRLLLAGLAVMVATIPVGATFPLQVAALDPTPPRAMRAAALILGVQTLGGMCGVLLAGFVLLPSLGIQVTHDLAVSLTALSAAALFALSIRERVLGPAAAEPAPPRADLGRREAAALGVVAGVVGAASLALEVLYTRVLGFFLPDLAWSFSAMLAVYLLAIAVGALVAVRCAALLGSTSRAGLLAMLGGAVTCASLCVVPHLWNVIHGFEVRPSGGFTPASFAAAACFGSLCLVAPAATLLAMFLPVAIGLLAPTRGSSPAAAFAYGSNCVGSAAGALLAGITVVPAIGLKAGIGVCGLVVFAAGSGLFLLGLARRRPAGRELLLAGTAASVLLVGGFGADLHRPLILDSGVFRRDLARTLERQLLASREGSVTVASVVEEGELRALFNDAFQAAGTGPVYRYMKMLGHLPMLLASRPAEVLVIAFGTGTTAGAISLHQELRRLTVVEISPEVLALSSYFEEVNYGLPGRARPGLEVNLVVDDGRAFLRRAPHAFDVISLEPLLPRTPAAAHFYTRGFFELARSRLAPAGVLCHWIPIHGQPLESLHSMLAAFTDVFERGQVFLYGSNAVLLGWNGEVPDLLPELVSTRFLQPAVRADLAAADLDSWEEVLGGFLVDNESLRSHLVGVAPVTDDRPRILYAGIRPNYEHFRYHAEALEFLLAAANPAASWFATLTGDPALRIDVARELHRRELLWTAADQGRLYREFARAAAADPIEAPDAEGDP